MTFTEIGALIGAITGAFTALDRFASGRPFVSLKRGEHTQTRDLSCFNSSKQDLLITEIRTWPASRGVRIAYGDSEEAIYDAITAQNPAILLTPGETRDLPLFLSDGKLVDRDSTELAPFVIVIGWRKTRSVWLPQFPVIVFSSARALRRLDAAK
jgi:hypothetical protein